MSDLDLKDDHEQGFDDNGPTLSTLANAIQCWAITNGEARLTAQGALYTGITLGEAALAFSVPLDRAAQAVTYHYWMSLSGEGPDAIIEHEGE